MPVESSPPKTNIGDAAKHKSLVGRVKRGLNLADGTVESNKAFRNIRQTAKLIAAEYFDFKKPWKSKDERTISTAVKECVREIPALTPFCFDANCRLLGMHLLARDLLMLLCQDETRNISRKPNAAKKERGEEVKLGRRKTCQGICCLAFLITRCSQEAALSLFGNIDSGYISTSRYHPTTDSSKFLYCCAFFASSSSLSIPSYSSLVSATYR